ncbi:MAG: M91 family zinc metallopeptidase [Aliidongia sp.]
MNDAAILSTKYSGIVVKVATSANPFFFALVQEALLKIHGKPVGRRLIEDIRTRGTPNPIQGFKVAICPPRLIRATGPGAPTDFTPGSKAVRASEDKAVWHHGPAHGPTATQRPGPGSSTAVFWNPNVISTPDGSRPTFIGLAHELIHARRNLLGIAEAAWEREEQATVGLNFNGDDITENAIRAEHGLPRRLSYGDIRDEFAYLADRF